jgi:diguanylate cyclase (GGDEF)-like protein
MKETMDVQNSLDLDEAHIASKVAAERARVFSERMVASAYSSPLGILLLAWIMYSAAGSTKAVIWACLISAVALSAVGIGYRYRLSLSRKEDPIFWTRSQITCAGMLGLTWGSSVWFIWVEGQFLYYLTDLIILVGVSGICMMIMSPVRSATFFFSVGMLLPPLVQLAVVDNPIGAQIFVGWVVMFAVQVWSARGLEQELFRELDHAVRNALLVTLLTQARGDLNQTNVEIKAKNEELKSAMERLNELVTRDQLTGAFSRRYIFEQLERMVAIKARHEVPVCLVMFDLDHFKSVNDHYGHPVGDKALQEVSRTVAAALRDGDMLARVGGEEFLALLPMTHGAAAALLAERLRAALAKTFVTDGPHPIFLPASFGVAELGHGEDVAAWFRRVDAALYEAKAQGRNAVVSAK